MARGLHAGADGAAVTSTARHGVRNGTLAALVGAVLALGACGGRELGDACGGPDDCGSALQCLNHRCTARCERAPDCGDGYACDDQGLCHPATGSLGDRCASEVDCASGLSCQINGAALDASNRLLSSCTAVNHEDDDLGTHTRAAGAACGHNGDCYNGTCALGHCVDLCRTDRDCAAAQSCVVIPSELATNAVFSGCLPSRGAITWTIPVSRPAAEILLPVPGGAQFAELVMTVGDQNQKVGAASVLSPRGERQYTLPCSPQLSAACGPELAVDQFFANPLRHQPGLGESVLTIPSGPASVIGPGMYRVKVSSFQPDGTPGTALPRVTAVVKLDAGAALDLHFFFLDLSAHPCLPAGEPLSAASAPRLPYFQTEFLDRLRALLNDSAGITLGPSTYEDVIRPGLDDVSAATAGNLLQLGKYATGINVFLVRSISPLGLPALVPFPGPAGVGGTRQSGLALSIDTACYRDWGAMARLTARALARYMGLPPNVELDSARHPTWRDPFPDSDDSSRNLMFYSDLAAPGLSSGSELSPGQRQLLLRSAVLR